jgi:hypothetical protein
MNWFSTGVVLLVSAGIIVIGVIYLFNPRAAAQGFGLPPPESGAHTTWWLRLKGVRDIVSGLVLLAMMMWSDPHSVGIVLLVQALIPLGDMTLVLGAKGSRGHAFGVHGVTAALMVAAALPLVTGRL